METLRKFAEFIEKINLDSGRNYKLSILESYKNDEDIKYYLEYVYNPYKMTGISDKKLYKKFSSDIYAIISDSFKDATVKEVLEYLLQNNTGSDTTIRLLQEYRKYMDQGLVWLFDRVVTKNIQLGINTTSINKVIPNLIPDFSVMLAQKYFENPTYVEGKEFALTTKIDGCRIIAIKENGSVKFFTRQGQQYEGLVDLEKEMIEKIPDSFCLDGELTLLDKGNLDSGEQYKETTKLCRTKDLEKHGLKMLVFDCMTAAEFKGQKCNSTYAERRKLLDSIFKAYQFKYFTLLPILYAGSDTSKITEILDEQVSNGEEGIMINIIDATYKFGRTMDLLKCKKFNSCDLRVVGFEEGTNKLAGTLGAVLLDYKGNILKCGSGFTDKQREEIWWHQYKYLNSIFEIKYFEETTNADGCKSLRFPIFKDFRPDKDEPSYY